MTDKEAIERLKRIDIRFFLSGMNEQSNYIVDEADKTKKAIEKVVNLIQTQQAEIDSLKDFKDIAENKVTELNPIGLARANQLLSRQCHNLQEEIEKKEFEIKALQMEHDHDVKMIDEVKGEAVKLYKIIDEMAIQLAGLVIWNDTKQEPLILGNVEEVKEYFKKKVEGI